MNKICTDVSQSKKLLDLGIDVNTADFHWFNNILMLSFDKVAKAHYDKTEYEYIPAWSLRALLELMPEIHGERPKLDTGRIETYKYYVEYPYHERTKKDWHSTELYDEPLDAAFEMVVWLKENNKL